MDEMVLSIKRDELFGGKLWRGIETKRIDKILEVVAKKGVFRRRGDVENDQSVKQIIPYVIFQNKDRYFLMQRKEKGSLGEDRLAQLYSLGIGGHLRESDIDRTSDVVKWAAREFAEEVEYLDGLSYEVVGILNDDTNPVGEVHLGIVMLAKGKSENIKIRDEHKMGKLVSLEVMKKDYQLMETWTQIVFDYLSGAK